MQVLMNSPEAYMVTGFTSNMFETNSNLTGFPTQ